MRNIRCQAAATPRRFRRISISPSATSASQRSRRRLNQTWRENAASHCRLSCDAGTDPIEAFRVNVRRSAVKTIGTGRANDTRRCSWEPPAVTKVAIGAKTRSGPQGENSASLAEPRPPSLPATKLGFAFEMAFPMSARSEQ